MGEGSDDLPDWVRRREWNQDELAGIIDGFAAARETPMTDRVARDLALAMFEDELRPLRSVA